jgi:hypothetical protein
MMVSNKARRGYFTSLRPVIFSRLPYIIALYFAFDRSRLSRIFRVSRMYYVPFSGSNGQSDANTIRSFG